MSEHTSLGQNERRVREALAFAFREWIHETDLSLCDRGADECPDWPLAYSLADLAIRALAAVGATADDLTVRGKTKCEILA